MKRILRLCCLLLVLILCVGCGETGKNPKDPVNPVDPNNQENQDKPDDPDPQGGKEPNNDPKPGQPFTFGEYENMESQGFIVLNEDGTFALTEVRGLGATLVEGQWGCEGDVLMFSNFNEFYDYDGQQIHNFEFRVKDKTTLVLMKDLEVSKEYDEYLLKDTLAEYEKQEKGAAIVSGQFDNRENYSFIVLNKDGTFALTEVVGMGATLVEGQWGREGDVLMFSNFDPFYSCDGEQLYNFEFRVKNSKTLTLMKDLEISKEGDEFLLME